MIEEDNVSQVLKEDGVEVIDIKSFQNLSQIKIDELYSKFGKINLGQLGYVIIKILEE